MFCIVLYLHRYLGESQKVRNAFRINCQEPDIDNYNNEYKNHVPYNLVVDLDRLPSIASEFFEGNKFKVGLFGWTPKLKLLLIGVSDMYSPLHKLYGYENSIVRKIYSYIAAEYLPHVTLTLPAKNVGYYEYHFDAILSRCHKRGDNVASGLYDAPDLSTDYVSFASCGKITHFPEPNNRNVNMMPFILGDKTSLPEDLQCYYDCIKQCPVHTKEFGNVCYLTVHESYVESQSSQRRSGLHIEAPGFVSYDTCNFSPGVEHHWGGGHFYSPDLYEGGIYFASNISNTSVVYNALIDKSIPGIVDKHGNCEHLRRFVGPGTKLEAGQLVWITDRTPHEALVQNEDGYRQFFRVVTSKVSHWFEQHSTPNPNVALPSNVIIVKENKFK